MKLNRFKSALRRLAMLSLLTSLISPVIALAEEAVNVSMVTSMGEIRLELYPEKAPATVENFVQYANSGFYDGTIFHRVIPSFMIQGGGFTPDMQQKATREQIRNEASNGLSNKRGTIAMARTNEPHSSTAQFFINVQDNPKLDYTGESTPRSWGYAVFGRVTSGMEVVEKIRFVETVNMSPYRNVPAEPVMIEQVRVLEQDQ